MPTTTYRTINGDDVSGTTATEVVEALRDVCRSTSTDIGLFMDEMATRLREWKGASVNTLTPDLFVASLLSCHWLAVVPSSKS